ncbi:MAG: TonB-dependent receptor [Deltaproteobacteria bacterium]|nr:TonB-dependent receptor [Kofleriaceae bacterium]
MRAPLVVTLALSASIAGAVAEPAVRRGRIVDEHGRGVGGAMVGTDSGASVDTDEDGRFVLPAGAGTSAFVYAEGYAPVAVELDERGLTVVTLTADEGAVEVIEVSGKPPDGASPTSYSLGLDQVRALPGTGNDVLRAVQSLPGVGRASYGIGALILRGAMPYESTVFLDGVEVPLAFHMGGLSSFYPSTLLDEVVVTPGGGDIQYGRGVGGVIELRGRAPRGDRWRVGGELGVLDASTYAEAPVAGGAISLGLRRSYADVILAEVMPEDRQVLPRYYDGQLRWDRTLAGGTLTALAFFSSDRIVGWGGTDYAQGFSRAALRWRRRSGRTTTTVMPWGGWGRSRVQYQWEEAETSAERFRLDRLPLGLRGDVVRDTSWGHVAAGIDLQGTHVVYEMPDQSGFDGMATHVSDAAWYGDGGVWAEARWRIEGGKLTLKPALRADYFGISQAFVLEPRLVATHELSSWFTLRETFGLYHQPPGPAEAVSPEGTLTMDSDVPHGAAANAVHASVGARAELPGSIIASVTGYHVRTGGVDDPDQSSVEATADGGGGTWGGWIVLDNLIGEEFGSTNYDRRRRWGAEISVQRRAGRWLTWLSYTIARNQQRPSRPNRDGWLLAPLDQTHNLNAVASVRLGAWQLGARLRWATGLPYTPRIGTMDDGEGGTIDVWGRPQSARLPDFLSIDLRIDRSWRRGWGTISMFVDVQNLTNAANPEGITFGESGETLVPGMPILPTLGLSFQPPS